MARSGPSPTSSSFFAVADPEEPHVGHGLRDAIELRGVFLVADAPQREHREGVRLRGGFFCQHSLQFGDVDAVVDADSAARDALGLGVFTDAAADRRTGAQAAQHLDAAIQAALDGAGVLHQKAVAVRRVEQRHFIAVEGEPPQRARLGRVQVDDVGPDLRGNAADLKKGAHIRRRADGAAKIFDVDEVDALVEVGLVVLGRLLAHGVGDVHIVGIGQRVCQLDDIGKDAAAHGFHDV